MSIAIKRCIKKVIYTPKSEVTYILVKSVICDVRASEVFYLNYFFCMPFLINIAQ